jgi:hypothetical protein
MNKPQGALIEFIESRANEATDELGIYRPDTILLNGEQVFIEKGSVEIKGAGDDDVVAVTMTIFARQVVLGKRAV